MRRILTIAMLLGLAGCSGEGFEADPCDWLPVPNQESILEIMWDARGRGLTRLELFGAFSESLGSPNVFGASPAEGVDCIDSLLDEVYGPL